MVMAEGNGKFKRRIGEGLKKDRTRERLRSSQNAKRDRSRALAEIGDYLMRRRSLLPLAGTRCLQDPAGRARSPCRLRCRPSDRARSRNERDRAGGPTRPQDHSAIRFAPRMVTTVLADAVQRMVG